MMDYLFSDILRLFEATKKYYKTFVTLPSEKICVLYVFQVIKLHKNFSLFYVI